MGFIASYPQRRKQGKEVKDFALLYISFDVYLHLKIRCKLGLKWIGLKTIGSLGGNPPFLGFLFPLFFFFSLYSSPWEQRRSSRSFLFGDLAQAAQD